MNTVQVTVNVLHRGETLIANIAPGERLTDALKQIGYSFERNDLWRLWCRGHPVSPGARVNIPVTVTMSHMQMGKGPF